MDDWRTTLGNFTNRQVVINTYVQDELVERDGLHFASIKMGSNRLELWRNDRIVKSIRIGPSASFVALAGFKDHYAFVDGEVRTELYFPH